MAIINQATKELQVKIVYYGPAMGGKTTNLVQVHDHVQTAAGNKGKLVSLATSSDRTLFFDFLPIEAMSIKGFKTKFQLYTVPGQVIYNNPPTRAPRRGRRCVRRRFAVRKND
jgi:signal recognition particle receptor subunit beta